MKNEKTKTDKLLAPTQVKTASNLMALIGEQLENIRPGAKPSDEAINAAGKASSLVNSAMGVAKVALLYARLSGQAPDLRFLGFSMPEKKAIEG